MHRRLVAIGRAAAAYGKFQAARESFAAAGQWVELMPLCALQGDFDALRDYAARVSGSQVGHSYRTPRCETATLCRQGVNLSDWSFISHSTRFETAVLCCLGLRLSDNLFLSLSKM